METPNIVWLTLESTRYDYTSLSGSPYNTTPELLRIAERPDSASFDRCFTHGIWTRPSSASILTGTYPSSHNVLNSTDTLPADLPTLPDLLSDVGYTTIGFGTNGQLDSLCEDIDSFDEYVPNPVRRNLHKVAGVTGLLKFLLQLRRYSGGYTKSITDLNGYLSPGYLITEGIKQRVDAYEEPLFLYAHYKDPHMPYIPPLPYQREYTADLDIEADEALKIILDIRDNRYEYLAQGCPFSETEWAALTAMYVGSLAHTDEQLGRAVDHIHSTLDDVILVITADHGDLLGEHDLLGHHLVTHDALCHVPLVVSGPTKILEYDGHVQHVDVVRTILEEVGARTDTLQGFDLRSEKRHYSVIQRGGVEAEKTLNRIQENGPDFDATRFHRGFLTALRDDDYKYERSQDEERLYALPDESTDVLPSRPEVVERFRDEYESFSSDIVRYEPRRKELSERRKRHLRDMGYLVD